MIERDSTVKYRAWDTQGYWVYPKDDPRHKFIQKMYYNVQDTYDNCQGDSKPGHESFGALLQDERYKIMQYVGYTGTCLVQMYAGDIVRHINHERLLWIGVNEVRQDEWGRWLPFGPHRKVTEEIDMLTILVPHEFEIIGNVWENPELLKEIKQ